MPDADLPRYFSVNGNLVRFVRTPGGGLDVQAWDPNHGFVRRMEFWAAVFKPGADVEELTESQFNEAISQICGRTS